MQSDSNKKDHVYPIDFTSYTYPNGTIIETWNFKVFGSELIVVKTDNGKTVITCEYIGKTATKESFSKMMQFIPVLRSELIFCAMSSGDELEEERVLCTDTVITSEFELVDEVNLMLYKLRV